MQQLHQLTNHENDVMIFVQLDGGLFQKCQNPIEKSTNVVCFKGRCTVSKSDRKKYQRTVF